MKKIISLGLAAILLCLALVSCDPKNDKESDSSDLRIPTATVDNSPDAPFNGEDDIIS